jgi:hypothetical protein
LAFSDLILKTDRPAQGLSSANMEQMEEIKGYFPQRSPEEIYSLT